MNKMPIVKIILLISFFFSMTYYACAESYNEDTCFKDYVTKDSKDVVIAVNRDTSMVELYWSDKDNTWLKPDEEYQKTLQKTYNKKLQLRQMQGAMDRMRQDTWYTTNQGGSGRR